MKPSFDELKALFSQLGWRDFGRQDAESGITHLFGLRVDGGGVTNCACNDKLSVHATYSAFQIGKHAYEGIEFDITAESSDGLWFSLKQYGGNNLDSLTRERVESITRRLVASWEAVQLKEQQQ